MNKFQLRALAHITIGTLGLIGTGVLFKEHWDMMDAICENINVDDKTVIYNVDRTNILSSLGLGFLVGEFSGLIIKETLLLAKNLSK